MEARYGRLLAGTFIALLIFSGVFFVPGTNDVTASGPPYYPITGKIVDVWGNGLSGITVTYGNVYTTTDDQGNFIILAIDGNYSLTISGPDITAKTMDISVVAHGLELGRVTVSMSNGSDIMPIILVVFVIVAVLGVALFVLHRRKSKNKQKPS